MPSTLQRNTKAVLDDIYSDYAYTATLSVPLAIDWGNEEQSESLQKQLPSPPPLPTSTHPLRIQKAESRVPLSPSEFPSNLTVGKDDRFSSQTYSPRHGSRTTSVESTESLWFAPTGFNTTPPRVLYSSPTKIRDSTSSFHDSMSRSTSSDSFWNSSTETRLTVTPRVRIFMYDLLRTPTEIHVGSLYEIISYVWDTMSLPENINALTKVLAKYTQPRSNTIGIVASSCLPLDQFLKSTVLHVHINPPQKPRYSGLDTLEITLHDFPVNALKSAQQQNVVPIKALLRVSMVQQIGEYLLNHVLMRDYNGLYISPSIDLARVKEGKGGGVVIQGLFGGALSYRWRQGRIEVLLRTAGEMYRIPTRLVREMYGNVRITALRMEDLDF